MSQREEHLELQFMENTDRMAKLYPPALMAFKRKLISQGFSSVEAFELTKTYLDLLVDMAFTTLDDNDNDEDEDDDEEDFR